MGITDLSYVNNLTPTAELRPAERSKAVEKNRCLSVLVEIEKLAIRDRKSPVEVYQLFEGKSLNPVLEPSQLKEYIKSFSGYGPPISGNVKGWLPLFHLDDINVDPQ